MIAPDYPGFGSSDMPDPTTFAYTFDKISELIEAFLKDRGFDNFGLFVQDYGGPVGFRIVNPESTKAGLAHHSKHQRLRDRVHESMGPVFAGLYGRIAPWKRKNRSQPFSKKTRLRGSIFTAQKISSGSAPITGSRISASCNATTRDAFSLISFTTTERTLICIRSGRHF